MAHFLRRGVTTAEPPLARQKEVLLAHYDAVLSFFGRDAGLRLARKHLAWYSRGLPGSAGFRAVVNQLADADAVIRLVHDFYDPLIARGIARGSAPALDAEAA